MSDKKNIDRLFQERFKDFEAAPPPAAWGAIENKLNTAVKPKTTVFPLWLMYTGIAVAVAIVLSIGVGIFTNLNNDRKNEFVKTRIKHQDATETSHQKTTDTNHVNTNKSDHTIPQKQEQPEVNKASITAAHTNSDTNKAAHLNATSAKQYDRSSVSNQQQTYKTSGNNLVHTTINPLKEHSAQNDSLGTVTAMVNKLNKIPKTVNEQHNSTLATNAATGNLQNIQQNSPSISTQDNSSYNNTSNKVSKSIDDIAIKTPIDVNTSVTTSTSASTLPSDLETVVDSTKIKKANLNAVALNKAKVDSLQPAAPFKSSWSSTPVIAPLYSNKLGGSSIGTAFVDNASSSGLNVSYGMLLGYNATPRISIRTGIHQVNMSYTTQGITYGVNSSIATALPLQFTSEAVTDTRVPLDPTNFSGELVGDNGFNGISGELSQRVGYIEVPLEISYKLIERKISLNVIAGMSALFLTDNSVAVFDGAKRLELGEDSNFNNFNQSANLGLGLGYKFSDKLGAIIEPVFKYQLNTLKRDVATFRPYNVGLYTGITYTF